MEFEGNTGAVADAAAEQTVDANATVEGTVEEGSGINPAWNPLLEKLPSSLHPLVTPTLKEWDSGVQKKFEEYNKVQSQYEPYKELIEAGISAEQLQQAHQLYNLINTNPQAFYEQMQAFYGYGGQGQKQQQTEEEEVVDINDIDLSSIENHPKFKELMNNQQMLAQYLVEQQESARMAELEKQTEVQLEAIRKQYNYEDEDLILVLQLANNKDLTLEDAAKMLNARTEAKIKASQTPAPNVFSATGGGVPAQNVLDPTKLDRRSTRDAVAAILAAQNGG